MVNEPSIQFEEVLIPMRRVIVNHGLFERKLNLDSLSEMWMCFRPGTSSLTWTAEGWHAAPGATGGIL